jgi:predicted small integral membrane protein
MLTGRISKISVVAALALLFSLVAFGNITDYRANLPFVQHVLMMDTVFPSATTRYRAVEAPALQQAAYLLIIAVEVISAALCWFGTMRLLRSARAPGAAFNRAKSTAVAGLTLGYLLWQVGLVAIGGEWFGMWMSHEWNGVESAFRFLVMTLGALVYVSLPDADLAGPVHS